MLINLDWTSFSGVLSARDLTPDFLSVNGTYYIYAFDGPFSISCILAQDGSSDQTDFETNWIPKSNISPVKSPVITQFERTDIDLKIAKASASVSGGVGVLYLKAMSERYTGGGYLKVDTFDIDDYVQIYVEDKDRMIAMELALGADPNATVPLDDSVVQAMGDIPGLGSFPNYPTIKSYTDDEQPLENQGWYFDPKPMGNNIAPMGECQIDPIGFYGDLPSGLYLKLIVTRPNVSTGEVRCDVFWGKSESGL